MLTSSAELHKAGRQIAPVFVAVVLGIIAVQAATLLAMGSPAICTCGRIALWYGNTSGPENSQQITDWYTFTHVVHGIGFYLLTWLVLPRAPLGLRLALAVGIEAGWEILENTPIIIERYRQSALAQGYVGDSVLNSVSDTGAAILGFFLARRLPVKVTTGLVIASELFLAIMIRDNLTLNIVQLLHPSPALSRWQSGQ